MWPDSLSAGAPGPGLDETAEAVGLISPTFVTVFCLLPLLFVPFLSSALSLPFMVLMERVTWCRFLFFLSISVYSSLAFLGGRPGPCSTFTASPDPPSGRAVPAPRGQGSLAATRPSRSPLPRLLPCPRSLHVRVSRDQGLPRCRHLAGTAARSSEDERNTTRNFPFARSSRSDLGSFQEILTFLARQVHRQQIPSVFV